MLRAFVYSFKGFKKLPGGNDRQPDRSRRLEVTTIATEIIISRFTRLHVSRKQMSFYETSLAGQSLLFRGRQRFI